MATDNESKHVNFIPMTSWIWFAVIITSWIWVAGEIGLLLRDRKRNKGSTADDCGTRLTLMVLTGGSIFIAALVAPLIPVSSPSHLPGRSAAPWQIAGLTMMWVGLMVRIWAVTVLGRWFRTTVEVEADQVVVDHGPYRWVRHPAYTGGLLLAVGFGLAAGWISLLITAIFTTGAMLRRIHTEERLLIDVLGDQYKRYRKDTKRLVPGLW